MIELFENKTALGYIYFEKKTQRLIRNCIKKENDKFNSIFMKFTAIDS